MTFFLNQRSRAANLLFGDPMPKQSAAQAQEATIDPGKWLRPWVPQGYGQRPPKYLVPNYRPPINYWIRRGMGG